MNTVLTDANFDAEVLKSDRPYLVSFWADWCAPCTMMAATIDSLRERFGDSFAYGKINSDDNPKTVEEYQVRGLPTVLLFRGGKVAEKFVGLVPRDNMERVLEFHI